MSIGQAVRPAFFEELPDGRPWQAAGACSSDPDAMHPMTKKDADWQAAQRKCVRCPVFDYCFRAHGDERSEGIVAGGRDREERIRFIQRHRTAA